MIRRLATSFFLVIALPAVAALQHDLGQGLHYVRITDLTKDSADLLNALSDEAVVLDLRSAISTPDAAAVLASKLEQPPPGKHGLRIILINPSSAAVIAEAVGQPHPRTFTIGPKTPALLPDIAVPATAEEDRKAYEALNAGVPMDKLISSNPEKRRFDEAALARNHANGGASDNDSDRDDEPDSITAKPEKPVEPPATTVPHDLVLGRAVQLYHALLVAKK